jgi:hypothetical protein
MTVFTADRVDAMQAALAQSLRTRRMPQGAHFTGVFEAGDEALTISVADGSGNVRLGRDPDPDFGLHGEPDAWEGYFSGDGTVGHGSVAAMLTIGDVSGGVVASSLAPSGDIVSLFRNLVVYNPLFEEAACPHRIERTPA